MKRVAVIGGGASGLAAALVAKRDNPALDVVVLERLARVGKKILATGNGQCNYTNTHLSARNYHGGDSGFIASVVSRFDARAAISFMRSLGVEPYTHPSGRVYPRSRNASAVLDALRFTCDALGVRVEADFRATSLEKCGNAWRVCSESGGSVQADAVVFAAGGHASSSHGTDGSAHALLKGLGVKFTTAAPALCGLVSADWALRALKGVRVVCGVYAERKGEQLYIETGEIIFTERGFSGIPILNASILHAENPLDAMVFDLLPDETDFLAQSDSSDCKAWELYSFAARRAAFPTRRADEFFIGVLPKMVGQTLLRRAGVALDCPVSSLDDAALSRLYQYARGLRFEVSQSVGFESAQATYGGVDSGELDQDTLRLKAHEGLFVCGEAMDVVGECGGYNLHWAWATGSIAGHAAAKSL